MPISDHVKRAIRLNKLSSLLLAVAVLNLFDIISSCCLVQMYGPADLIPSCALSLQSARWLLFFSSCPCWPYT